MDGSGRSCAARRAQTRCVLSLSVLVTMSILAATSANAGPCTAEIDRLQSIVDAGIDITAGAGPGGRESTAAKDHHQPTPNPSPGPRRGSATEPPMRGRSSP